MKLLFVCSGRRFLQTKSWRVMFSLCRFCRHGVH